MDETLSRPPLAGITRRSLGGLSRFDEQRSLRMLGLSPSPDPVTIITAAHLRLRRWRRAAGDSLPGTRERSLRILRIMEARDTLLRRSFRPAGLAGTGPS